MIIDHLPTILYYRSVPEHKYENCITREKYEENIREKDKDNIPDKNGYIKLNPSRLEDLENELFSGDKIIGFFSDGKRNECCLYTWKENNPREIKAYVIINKWKSIEKIGDIEIIKKEE